MLILKSKPKYNIFKQLTIVFLLIVSLIVISCTSSKDNVNKYYDKLLPERKEALTSIDTSYLFQKARSFVIEGSTLQMQNKHAEAILAFNQALRYDSSAAIWYMVARSYKELNKIELAVEALHFARMKDPNFLPALDLLAQIFFNRMEFDSSAKILEEAIKIEPKLNRKLQLARIYESKDIGNFVDLDKAIKIYQEINIENESIQIWRVLAQLYQKKKDYNNFKLCQERIFNLAPHIAENGIKVIELYLDSEDYESAFKVVSKLDTLLDSDDLAYCYGLIGNSLIDSERKDLEQYMNKFIRIFDSKFYFNWKIHLQAAYVAHKVNDTVRRDSFFSHALKVSDTLSDIKLQVAVFYLQINNLEKSKSILENASNDNPKDFRFAYFLGLIAIREENYDLALQKFYFCNEKDSNNAEYLVNLGLIFDRKGLQDSSDKYYLKAISKDPKNPLANNNYAYSLSVRGIELEKALLLSKISLMYEPQNSSYLDTYAWINYQLGKYEIALEYIQKAIATKDVNAELYEHYGDILLKIGKKQEAINAYKNSLELEPDRKSVISKINP